MSEFGPFKLDNWSIKRIFSLAAVVHVIAAIFSEGFFQFDEHFQILEFLGHKLNGTSASDLPWEFKEQIRPWFQVFLYYLVLAPLNLIGLDSPFVQATVLRILTSLVSLWGVYSLRFLFNENVNKFKIYSIALLFSWFIPVIHARASSENLSAAFIFVGIGFLMKSLKKDHFLLGMLAGLFLGMGYLVKSQLAIAVAFLWFRLVIFNFKSWRTSVSIAVAILVTIGLGFLVDKWGYGEWTFSTWNYFNVNILENRVSGFGIDPWWYYFKLTFMKGIPLISLPYILGSFFYWYKCWKSPITWLTAPFFFIHCLIGHKELRFIFLVVLLAPYMSISVLYAYEKFSTRWIKLFVILNLVILIPASLKSANSSIRFFKHISSSDIQEFQAHGENPYSMVGLKMNFYFPDNLKVTVFKDKPEDKEGYIFFRSGKKYFEYSERKDCQLEYLSYPQWSLNFNIGNWIGRSRVWSLWKCSK